MKIVRNIAYLLFAIVALSACDQEDTQVYDKDRASVNFDGALTQFSFATTDNLTEIVSVPFYINGLGADYIRSASFEIVQDSTTAVEGENADFSIVSTEVLPNEFTGTIKVRVNKPADEDVSVYFRVVNGDDFSVGISDETDHKLIITNKLTPPYGWSNDTSSGLAVWKSKYYLGTYSTAYYKFIIDVTGVTEYPYPVATPGFNNDEKWGYDYAHFFTDKVKTELRKYNESIAPEVLLHDDGPAKGLPVVVDLYYIFE